MSRYDDRGRPLRYDRDRSPDYAYAGGSGIPPRVPSPGHTTFIPPAVGSQARLEYEPQTPFYPPPPPNYNNLQIPDARARPRSLPPPADYRGSRSRHHDDRSRDRSPIGKAKKVLENTFTDSTTGLGVGVLGALVGGLAAHEAAEATSRHGGGHHNEAQRRNQLLSTVVGAAVGALGANAVEKRLEVSREKTNAKQDKWEQKWGRRSGDAIDRPRSGGGGRDDWDLEAGDDGYGRRSRPGSRGVQREIDPDARSWKNVEDWVYDSRDGDRSRDRRGRRSEEGYRY